MILYHGSTVDITEIDLLRSKPCKDFGRGFYLSADEQQAINMAEYKAYQIGGTPIVNRFEFDEAILSSPLLNVKCFEGYTEDWAKFVFENRNAAADVSIHDFDIVYGPIANDRVGLQIRRYMENEITFEVFLQRLQYMKGITYQYFFGTQQAIKLLKKL